MIALKRAYEQPAKQDGCRILVERLWPRGLGKEKAAIDLWLKDVAPSTALRQWFGHDPDKWSEFTKRYWAELKDAGAVLRELQAKIKEGPVTLVYAARDQEHNSAVALREFLKRRKK